MQGRVLYSAMLASLLLSALAVAAQDAQAAPTQSDTAHIVVVATTDVHGRATGWDYLTDRPFAGGLVRVATVVDSLRLRYPGQVVVVDAGDLIQGDPFAAFFAREETKDPNPVIEAMNLVGYDAATPGNHEFNWGLPTLRRALVAAAFPYVSANIYGLPGDTLMYRPYVILRRGDIRIGIAGFTTPGVMVWDRENVRGQARVGRVAAGADGVLREMRRQSDLAVVLIHSGMEGDASYDTTGVGPENVAASLADRPVPPDLVVVGHSHREMRDSVLRGVHFVQPKNWAQSVSVVHVDLVRENDRWRPAQWRAELVPLGNVEPSPRVTAGLAGAHQAVRDWTAQPLAEALGPMPATLARAGPSAIIGFIHAVQRKHTGAQLSAAAAFSTSGGFPAGQIRLADVAGIYPYENTLRAIRLSGAQLKAFLEHSSRYYRLDGTGRAGIDSSVPGYNFDMVSGASYEIDLTRPVGDRIRGLSVGGRPVAPADSFTMAINNYRQGGGGGYAMLRGAPVIYDRDENIRDLLVAELRARRRIDPRTFADSNWRIVPAAAAAQVRALQRGADPKGALATERDSVMLRIVTTNDLHGALLPRTYDWSRGRPVGGAAAIEAVMDTLEASCACPTLWLDGGDQMQGTLASNLFAGRSTVDVLSRMGLDAAVVGNHDLDWTVDTLRARMKDASYPWLAANVFDSATGRRPDWAVPSRIVTAGTLRVGIIGYMTPLTKTIVMAEHVRGLRFGSGRAAIADVLDAMRAERPDFTIILAHEGGFCDSIACRGEIVDLARELGPGSVDAIVAGHTHQRMETEVAGIPIVQARSSGTALGMIDFVWKTGGGRAPRTSVQTVYADSVTPDSAIAAIVASYTRRTDSIARRPIASVKLPLPKAPRGGQYALGNLIADAQRNAVRAQVAVMNNGGIRGTGLEAGPLTYADIFELQPFQNEVVTVTVTGAILRRVAEHALESGTPDAHLSGMTVRYDPKRAAGRRVVAMRLDDGTAIRNGSRYSLAVTNFMAGGGSGYAMLIGLPARPSGIADIDALSAYLRRRPQPVEVPAAPRFVSVRK